MEHTFIFDREIRTARLANKQNAWAALVQRKFNIGYKVDAWLEACIAAAIASDSIFQASARAMAKRFERKLNETRTGHELVAGYMMCDDDGKSKLQKLIEHNTPPANRVSMPVANAPEVNYLPGYSTTNDYQVI